MNAPVEYRPDLETPSVSEQETIRSLEALFVDMATTVAEKEGHAHRAVHAKGQGLFTARLSVFNDLPEELRQGLFAGAGQYDAYIRLSSPPAEQLSDAVSTPRALALKVLGVSGERVEGGDEKHSQDFLMVNGPSFTTPGPDGFLRNFRVLATTTEKAPGAKAALSKVLRGVEHTLEKIGGGSGSIKQMGGQPQVHPLGETFFSQVPYLYGRYIAKFSLAPISSNLVELDGQEVGDSPDAQREAVHHAISTLDSPAEWELRVQLCRDVEKMPVEDASIEWPQSISPFVAVARVVVERQAGWDGENSQQLEDRIAFSPWHALAAHRPLGAINRARRIVMAASRRFRSEFNRCPIHEPTGV
ncbi:catalase family protein [Xanthomonas arboricola]|uniref:catalase family protein n=1 Tax=Xanthomonas arboricola TaxID=56448 RepID=UPI003EB80740